MKQWLHRIESFVDRAIPYALIVLVFIIIAELFFKEFAEKYHLWLLILDYIVIGLFVIDLAFKYNRIRNFKNFFKECWLDILAVFPFVLAFRLVEEVVFLTRFSAEFKEGQSILHTIVEGRREFAELFGKSEKLIREAEAAGKISRTERFLRVMRPVARAPRLVKAIPFYEKPIGKHHLHEMEELEEAGKGIKKAERIALKDLKKISRDIKKKVKQMLPIVILLVLLPMYSAANEAHECDEDTDCIPMPLDPETLDCMGMPKCENHKCIQANAPDGKPCMAGDENGICKGGFCTTKKLCKNDFACIKLPAWKSPDCIESARCEDAVCIYNIKPLLTECKDGNVAGYCSYYGKCMPKPCIASQDCYPLPSALSGQCLASVECVDMECRFNYKQDSTKCTEKSGSVCLRGGCVSAWYFQSDKKKPDVQLAAKLIGEGTFRGAVANKSSDWYIIRLNSGQRIDAALNIYSKKQAMVSLELFDEEGNSLTEYSAENILSGNAAKVYYETGSKNEIYTIYIKISTEWGGWAEPVGYKLDVRTFDMYDANSQKDASDDIYNALEISPGIYSKNWIGHTYSDDNADYYHIFVRKNQHLHVELRQEDELGVASLQIVPQPGWDFYDVFERHSSFDASDEVLSIHAMPKKEMYVYFKVSPNRGGKYILDVWMEGNRTCEYELAISAINTLRLEKGHLWGHAWLCLKKTCNNGKPFSSDCWVGIEKYRDDNVRGECCYGFWPEGLSTKEILYTPDDSTDIEINKGQFVRIINGIIEHASFSGWKDYSLISHEKPNCVTWVTQIVNPILREQNYQPIKGWTPSEVLYWIKGKGYTDLDLEQEERMCGISKIKGMEDEVYTLPPVSNTAGNRLSTDKKPEAAKKDWLKQEKDAMNVLRKAYREVKNE